MNILPTLLWRRLEQKSMNSTNYNCERNAHQSKLKRNIHGFRTFWLSELMMIFAIVAQRTVHTDHFQFRRSS